MTAPVWVSASLVFDWVARAIPKSVTLTRPDCGHQHVAGLDVAVHDAVAVRERERAGDLGADLGRLAGGSGPFAWMRSRRLRPSTYSMTMKYVPSLLAPVVDGDDVGVVQVGGGLGLAPEPLDEARVAGELGEEHLDRHRTVEQLVAGEVHLRHPAPCDPALDLVAVGEDVGDLRHRPKTLAGGASDSPEPHASTDRSSQQQLDHLRGDRRRDAPAGRLAAGAPAALDEHRHRDLRVFGRREPDEPRVWGAPISFCAVPVLPATVTPGICAARAGAAPRRPRPSCPFTVCRDLG